MNLEAHRDAAFGSYGELHRLQVNGSSALLTINPNTPDELGRPIGQLGQLALSGSFSELWRAARPWFVSRGCAVVRGPISRHTWYPFRVVTDGFSAGPAMTGEPWNGPELADSMRSVGFEDVAFYVSTWTNAPLQIERSAHKLSRLREAGYSVRTLDPAQLNAELAWIHGVTVAAFSAPFNYMFHPIGLAEFQAVLGDGGGLDPRMILLCTASDGAPAGFVYCTPEAGGVASIKTLVVHPAHRSAGVGGALVALAHETCRALGFRRIAHALMRADGPSVAISATGEHEVFRRYSVMEAAL